MPKFKVRHITGADGLNKLTLQSLNDDTILVKDVLINDNDRCSTDLKKYQTGLESNVKREGDRNAMAALLMVAQLGGMVSYPLSLKFGDAFSVPVLCEVARVRIQTDSGEALFGPLEAD